MEKPFLRKLSEDANILAVLSQELASRGTSGKLASHAANSLHRSAHYSHVEALIAGTVSRSKQVSRDAKGLTCKRIEGEDRGS